MMRAVQAVMPRLLTIAALASAGCAQPGGTAMPPGRTLAQASQARQPAWVARVWSEPQGRAVVLDVQRAGLATITNRDFLPPGLGTGDGIWQLQHLGWEDARLTVTLLHRTGQGQDRWTRRFEFDLSQPGAPLTAFYTATYRQGRVDWQQVDLAAQSSIWCRGATDPAPDACPQPVPAEVLTNAPVTSLANIGPAFDYVPPIRRTKVR